eukprot:COSAG01_NODE_1_length_100484_cov_170.446142_39_plen_151_part_00
MSYQLFFVILVLITGILSPFQAGINAELNRHLGHPLLAATFNCFSATVYLLLLALILKVPMPTYSALLKAPWWAWLGGACGATFVTINLMAAPKLGALLLMISFIIGTVLASVLVDSFGLVGYSIKAVSTYRLLGLFLLGLSVYFIYKGS